MLGGRGSKSERQCRRLSAGTRGRNHPPARRPSPRRLPGRDTGSHVARDARRRRVRLQSPFAVAVYAPLEAPGLLGSGARPLRQPHADAGLSLDRPGDPRRDRGSGRGRRPADAAGGRARSRGGATCLSTDDEAPRVVARLPFGARGNARTDGADALAIGCGAQQETGRDRTLLVTENAADISRGRMLAVSSRRSGWPAPSWPRASMPEAAEYADRDRGLRADLAIRASTASARNSAARSTA